MTTTVSSCEITFNEAQRAMRAILLKSLKEIVDELLTIKPNDCEILRGNRGAYIRNGIVSKCSNDFMDYYWIKVMVGNNGYCLTMFYDDICPKGIHRHQNGKIQFRKSANNDDIDPPSEDNNYVCSFRPELTDNPEMNLDEKFCANSIAKKFVKYIEKKNQKNSK